MYIIYEQSEAMIPENSVAFPQQPRRELGQTAKPDFLHELAIAVSAEAESLRAISELPSVSSPLIQRLLKRGIDAIASFIGLILFAPLFLVIAAWIKRDSEGPVFYCQERIGEDGKPFRMVKFRTMYTNAEQLTGPVWAKDGDPRVTNVGRFLRQSKLDELPQLVNVLKGEMSLVGPRPERPTFVDLFGHTIPGYNLRHQIRPGITGLAQIENGYDKEARDVIRKLHYDVTYIYEGNLFTDLVLICRTIGRAFKNSVT